MGHVPEAVGSGTVHSMVFRGYGHAVEIAPPFRRFACCASGSTLLWYRRADPPGVRCRRRRCRRRCVVA
eukprot:2707312-Prymnesium_polylepis.1